MKELQEVQEKDDESRMLKKYITEGFQKHSKFQQFKDELTVNNSLIMKGSRIFIPKVMRKIILTKIHEGHMGIVKCRRCKESVWWPGLSTEITNIIKSCVICARQRSNHKELLMTSELPPRPWMKLDMDLMDHCQKKYLVIQDYYSRYIE